MGVRRVFIADVVAELVGLGATVQQDARTKLVLVSGHITMRLVVSTCRHNKRGDRWKLHLWSPLKPALTVFARLASGNKTILDYLCFRANDLAGSQITVGEDVETELEIDRYTDLTFLQNTFVSRTAGD